MIFLYILGHAGHDVPDNVSMEIPSLKTNRHLYDLNGQIKHKVKTATQ